MRIEIVTKKGSGFRYVLFYHLKNLALGRDLG